MELLIVVVIFGITGLTATTTLFSLLRGASKTEVVKDVKQNGDYTITIMEQKIRNAIDIGTTTPCDGTARTSLEIVNADNSHTIYSCETVGSINKVQERTELATNPSPSPNYMTTTSVTLPSCTTAHILFTCTPTTNSKLVSIQFTLVQSATAPNSAETASETFVTQVGLRNN